MSKQTRQLEREITGRIIEELKEGVAPWVRPWDPRGAIPRNRCTGRPYTGGNIIRLWDAATVHGYASSEWMTFVQARKRGGHVRAGERATKILAFGLRSVQVTNESGEESEQLRPFGRWCSLFNLEQVDGVDPKPVPERSEFQSIDEVDRFLVDVGADCRHGGDRACYSPTGDFIRLPRPADFTDPASYYAVSLHEHAHWTGHSSRLCRGIEQLSGMNDPEYAREELVAELSAAFLCGEFGIAGALQHPEYLGPWVDLLSADPSVLIQAATKASKAVEFLKGVAEGRREAE